MTLQFLSLHDDRDQQRSRRLPSPRRKGLRESQQAGLCAGLCAGLHASLGAGLGASLCVGLYLLPLTTALAENKKTDSSRGTATISITKIDKVLLEPQFDALVPLASTEAGNTRVDLCFGHAPGSAAYQVTVYSVDATPPAAGQTRGFSEYKPAASGASGTADSDCEATSPWGMSVPVSTSDRNESESDASEDAKSDEDLSLMLLVSPE